MEGQNVYSEKILKFTYEEYEDRGMTLKGLIIDKYVIYDLIGEGSNGKVYKGMDDRTKKQVAVKLMDLRQINAQSKLKIKMIKQKLCESEPRLMYQCNSPYLIKCFDVYRNDDLKIIVTEYCNGKTLQAEINEKKRLSEQQAVQIIKHVINGLMELHRNKIIHRDLKAENIMSHSGTYKIIDFGFSKKLQISRENEQLKGTAVGTITTMAPEVMSQRKYGLKADIWSIGVIFFQMIYGIYPYDSVTCGELYNEIRNDKVFNKKQPLTVNGYKPSQKAFDFIKFLMVFDTKQRPDWKEVANHPLIKEDNQEVNQRFIKKVDVILDKSIDDFSVKDSMYNESQINLSPSVSDKEVESPTMKKSGQIKVEKISSKQIKKQPQEPKKQQKVEKPSLRVNLAEQIRKQKEMQQARRLQALRQQQIQDLKKQKQQKQAQNSQNLKITYLNKTVLKIGQGEAVYRPKELKQSQIILKKNQQNTQEKKQYEFTQRANLQCLKTQLIYRQIINPIICTSYLDMTDRDSIEFIYLLLARCFSNMSPINLQIKQRQSNKELIINLKNQITPLYDQVSKKFQEYSIKLTEKQNKWKSIVGDFFVKKLYKQTFMKKEKFLIGVELFSYTKEEQIAYTFQYYQNSIKAKIEKIDNISNVFKRLNKYVEINKITHEQLSQTKKTFAEIVKNILA